MGLIFAEFTTSLKSPKMDKSENLTQSFKASFSPKFPDAKIPYIQRIFNLLIIHFSGLLKSV